MPIKSAVQAIKEKIGRLKDGSSQPVQSDPISFQRTNLISLSVQFEGKADNAKKDLDKKLDDELKKRTGLSPQDVTFSGETTYAVTIYELQEGKRGERTHVGSSTSSVDDAVANALAGEVVDHDKDIFVAVDRTAEAPYFLVPLVQRSVDKKGVRLRTYREEAVQELRNAYGARLKQEPDSIRYEVFRLRREYGADGALPKGRFDNKDVASHGRSDVSMDDAVARADEKLKARKIKTTVYQETAFMLVYGHAEAVLRVKDGIALPLVTTSDNGTTIVTSQKSGAGIKFDKRGDYKQPEQQQGASPRTYGRSGSPAARDTIQLPSMTGLM